MLTKVLCSTLLCCLFLSLSAQNTPKERPYRMGHTQGYFPYDKAGCEDSKRDCSQMALAAFLDSVWQQPHPAPGEPARGKVTVSFIVEKDGSLSEMNVFEDPQNGLKEAAISALERMNELEIHWVPGEYKDKVVRSQQSLEFPMAEMKQAPVKQIYKVVEQMPMFPGCEDIGDHVELARCAQQELLMFIYGNIKYPPKAKADKVEGMAVISFIVTADGRTTDAKIIRDPGAGTGEEALRVINLMSERNIYWIPGTQGGKPVDVQFNMPIKFKVE